MRTRALAVCLLFIGCGGPPDCPPTEAPAPVPPSPSEAEVVPAPEEPEEPEEPRTPPTAGPDAHRFDQIVYPTVDDAFGPGTRLELEFFGSSLRILAEGLERDPLEGMEVRMHFPDGSILEPSGDAFANVFGGSRMQEQPRTSWMRQAPFTWTTNTLDEAWVSLDLGEDGRYWLEIPYGCARDPDAPLPESDRRTLPRYAPAMSELSARDHVVPFRHVRYDMGQIENGWRLAVLASNPFDAHVELELYRDDGGVGQSAYLWAMDEPGTSATFVAHGHGRLESMRMMTLLHEDGLRRSDHFHFFHRPSGRRSWGTLEVSVAGVVHALRVPSSLFLYTHGTADPYDTHRTVGAAGVLGPDLF